MLNGTNAIVTHKSQYYFLVSRRRREMYIGHGRLCVCPYVCVSVCPSPHAHTTARTRM